MGILLSGPVAADGSIRYGFMFANNESISPEDDRHKRLYGQLEIYPADGVTLTLGADYASHADGHAFNVNFFAGYATERLRIGAEGFFSPRTYDDLNADLERAGITGFFVVAASESMNAVFRVDRSSEDSAGQETTNTLGLAGLGIRVDSGVEIIPNIMYEKDSRDEDASVSGRVTLVVTIR
jgi:hypothetical protein